VVHDPQFDLAAVALPRTATDERPTRGRGAGVVYHVATTRSSRPTSASHGGQSLVHLDPDRPPLVDTGQGQCHDLVVADLLDSSLAPAPSSRRCAGRLSTRSWHWPCPVSTSGGRSGIEVDERLPAVLADVAC